MPHNSNTPTNPLGSVFTYALVVKLAATDATNIVTVNIVIISDCKDKVTKLWALGVLLKLYNPINKNKGSKIYSKKM